MYTSAYVYGTQEEPHGNRGKMADLSDSMEVAVHTTGGVLERAISIWSE